MLVLPPSKRCIERTPESHGISENKISGLTVSCARRLTSKHFVACMQTITSVSLSQPQQKCTTKTSGARRNTFRRNGHRGSDENQGSHKRTYYQALLRRLPHCLYAVVCCSEHSSMDGDGRKGHSIGSHIDGILISRYLEQESRRQGNKQCGRDHDGCGVHCRLVWERARKLTGEE